jgi:hypothetical protein
LRAKVNLSIEAQDPKYEYLKAGAGSNEKGDARDPGELGAGEPGGRPATSDRSAPALEGETLPEFAARMGLDPQAWRGLEAPLAAGLTLGAGVEVGFKANVSVNAGIGMQAGVAANLGASLEASFGLSASASASARVGAGVKQGFALSAAGGVNAAVESVRIAQSTQAAEAARAAFSTTGGAAGAGAMAVAAAAASPTAPAASAALGQVARQPGLPPQERTPLTEMGVPSPAQQLGAAPAPPPPQADARAATFGFGVPLRPRVGGRVAAPVVIGARPANLRQEQRRPAKPCGCPGPCRCQGASP